ncbi:MAG: hypothetical protein RLZZ44_1005 [Bacteroidota bacterium]
MRKALNSEPIQIDVCKKIIGTLENDAQRAANIIKSLRSIFTDDDANIEFIEVIKILPTVLEVIKKEVDEENIHIDLKIDKNLKVQFNPTEFQQVLLNLFSNSIHALSNSNNDPKKITLEASKIASKIRITITDNGNGITKEFQPNLFELLSTTKQTGMGLGLWLCKHIINRQNGNIWHEENEMGAKFVIELPEAN